MNDIHFIVLSPASYVDKYGYGTIMSPLIEDLKFLETYRITVSFNGSEHHFKGILSMFIAGNVAAHAFAGVFYNFSTVQSFCHLCNTKGGSVE